MVITANQIRGSQVFGNQFPCVKDWIVPKDILFIAIFRYPGLPRVTVHQADRGKDRSGGDP
jgi:hypothetical protein